jgi:hypothetical protein
LLAIGIVALAITAGVIAFLVVSAQRNKATNEMESIVPPVEPPPVVPAIEEPKGPFTYVTQGGATYQVIDADTRKRVFADSIVSINADELSYIDFTPNGESSTYQFATFDIADNQTSFTSASTTAKREYSPAGTYAAEFLQGQAVGTSSLTIWDSKTQAKLRVLLPLFGHYQWVDDHTLIFSDLEEQCASEDPLSDQPCSATLSDGVSIFDAATNTRTLIWSEPLQSGLTQMAYLYNFGGKIYFTRRVETFSDYQQPYAYSYVDTHYEYDLQTSVLNQVSNPPHVKVIAALETAGLPINHFRIQDYLYDPSLAVVKLFGTSALSNFYLVDLSSPTTAPTLVANGDKLLFSDINLESALDIEASPEPMIVKTADGQFQIYSDPVYGFAYNVPITWVNTFPGLWVPLAHADAFFSLSISATTVGSALDQRFQSGQPVGEQLEINGFSVNKTVQETSSYTDHTYIATRDSLRIYFRFRSYSVNSYANPPVIDDYSQYVPDFEALVHSLR